MEEVIKSIAGCVSAVLIYLLGGIDVALQALLIFIVLDYLTGISKAIITKKLNSSKGFNGILKKVLILVIVVVSVLLDRMAGDTGMIRSLVIYYLCANEGLSILENLSEADIVVPKSLKKYLEKLRDTSDSIDEIEDDKEINEE